MVTQLITLMFVLFTCIVQITAQDSANCFTTSNKQKEKALSFYFKFFRASCFFYFFHSLIPLLYLYFEVISLYLHLSSLPPLYAF